MELATSSFPLLKLCDNLLNRRHDSGIDSNNTSQLGAKNTKHKHQMQPPCVSRAPPSEVLWQLRWHRPPRPASFHEDVRQLHVFRATQVSSLFTLSTTTAKDEQQSSHQRDATMMTEYGCLSRIVFLRHSGRVRVGECGQVLILHLIGAVGIKACCVSMCTAQCCVAVDNVCFFNSDTQIYNNLKYSVILHLIGAVGIKACCVSMYIAQCCVTVDNKFFQQRYTNLQQLKIQRVPVVRTFFRTRDSDLWNRTLGAKKTFLAVWNRTPCSKT